MKRETDLNTLNDRLHILQTTIPADVRIVAAGKTRSAEAIHAALDAGIREVGHNYVQEARTQIDQLGREACTWHFIGHLQRNKAGLAASLFDMIQTVDSLRLAQALDRACADLERVLPILIEVNSARETQKAGVAPDEVSNLVTEIAQLRHLRIEGLMTMGPAVAAPDELRPYFQETKALFDHLVTQRIPGTKLHTLSMGMSTSFNVAIEEGATMVRLGTVLFGPRRS